MNYSKPTKLVTIITLVICIAVGSACAMNPSSVKDENEQLRGNLNKLAEKLNDEAQLVAINEFDVPDEVFKAAVSYADEMYEMTRADFPQFNYVDYRIEALGHSYTYENLDGMSLEVYRMNYEFQSETPEDVPLAGGMQLGEDGWIVPIYANCTYLIFSEENDSLEYLFGMMENDCEAGDPTFTNDLLQRLSYMSVDDGLPDGRMAVNGEIVYGTDTQFSGLSYGELIQLAPTVDGAYAEGLGSVLYNSFMVDSYEFLVVLGSADEASAYDAMRLISYEVIISERHNEFTGMLESIKESYDAAAASGSDIYDNYLGREAALLKLEEVYLSTLQN